MSNICSHSSRNNHKDFRNLSIFMYISIFNFKVAFFYLDAVVLRFQNKKSWCLDRMCWTFDVGLLFANDMRWSIHSAFTLRSCAFKIRNLGVLIACVGLLMLDCCLRTTCIGLFIQLSWEVFDVTQVLGSLNNPYIG